MSALFGVCQASDLTGFKAQVLPHLAAISTDPTNSVRIAFSDNLVEICPVLGKDVTASQLLPMILRLVKDDDADVRLNIITKVDVLSKIIGPEQLRFVQQMFVTLRDLWACMHVVVIETERCFSAT